MVIVQAKVCKWAAGLELPVLGEGDEVGVKHKKGGGVRVGVGGGGGRRENGYGRGH